MLDLCKPLWYELYLQDSIELTNIKLCDPPYTDTELRQTNTHNVYTHVHVGQVGM